MVVCVATSGVLYAPSARGAAGSKQSAAVPAELAPQGALAAKTVAPTTVVTREIVSGGDQRRGLGARESLCGCPSPRCGPGRSWRTFRFWKLRSNTSDAGRRRPRRRSGHVDKTGPESGHMAGTSAGAIERVHSRSQVCRFFAAGWWTRSCRLCVLAGYSLWWWREWCCGGLPPPGKGPSPAVWGEGLYRLSLDAGVQVSRSARRAWVGCSLLNC